MQSKLMDWFLYDSDHRYKRLKSKYNSRLAVRNKLHYLKQEEVLRRHQDIFFRIFANKQDYTEAY